MHNEPPLDEATLPTDYVLLTHNHRDHTCIESIQRISKFRSANGVITRDVSGEIAPH